MDTTTPLDILIVVIGALGTLMIWGPVIWWLLREKPAPLPPPNEPPERPSGGDATEPPVVEARPVADAGPP